MNTRPMSLRKAAPIAGAFLMAMAAEAGAKADTFLGPVNGAECYTPEVLNEELDMGYGQSQHSEWRRFMGPWRSVILYKNQQDNTWTLVGKPYAADAKRITKFENLLCIIDGGEGDEYKKSPHYRGFLGMTPP